MKKSKPPDVERSEGKRVMEMGNGSWGEMILFAVENMWA